MYPLYGCSGQRETSRFSNVSNHITPLNKPVVILCLSVIQQFIIRKQDLQPADVFRGMQNDCTIVTNCFT